MRGSGVRTIGAVLLGLVLMTSCFHRLGPEAGGDRSLWSWLKRTAAPRQKSLQEEVREAMKDFERGRYVVAFEKFQTIRDRYPTTPYALLAELKMADCKFYSGSYEEAIVLYEQFEKLHPTNEAIPYVIFQIGSAYYRMMLSPDRDQTNTRKAIEAYERLLRDYPDSPYTFEARRRIGRCRDNLAAHEYYVAHYYFRVKKYRAAYARLEYLLKIYPDTRSAPKAQRLLRKTVQKLGPEFKPAESPIP
ncbi:outer membrane protein assembly factor BamD [Thermosulfuriphilus sp.]